MNSGRTLGNNKAARPSSLPHAAVLHRLRLIGAAAAVSFTAGCSALDAPEQKPVATPAARPPAAHFQLVIEQGQSQFVAEGEFAPEDVRIRVMNGQQPLPRERLAVLVADGGGQLSDSVTVTDDAGYALLPPWRVGAAGRPQRVLVRLRDSTREIHATSYAERIGVTAGRMLLERHDNALVEWRAGSLSPSAVAAVPPGYWLASVSPNDSLLAVVSRDEVNEVCLMPVVTGQRRCISELIAFQDPHRPSGFSWSPDGQRLAFGAQRGESNECPMGCPPLFAVRVLDVTPLKLRWIFDYTTLSTVSAAWSPDGRHLAHTNGDTLRITDADGKNARDVARLGRWLDARDLRWSPDGRRIAALLYLAEPAMTQGVGVIDVATGKVDVLVRFPGGYPQRANRVAWSPDGNTIAFGWTRGDDDDGAFSHVYTVPATGGPVVRMVRHMALVDWR